MVMDNQRSGPRSVASGTRSVLSTGSQLLSPQSLPSDPSANQYPDDSSDSPSISTTFLSESTSRHFNTPSRASSRDSNPPGTSLFRSRSATSASPYFGSSSNSSSPFARSSPLDNYGTGRSLLGSGLLNRTPNFDYRSSPPFLIQDHQPITFESLRGSPTSSVTDPLSFAQRPSVPTSPSLPRQQSSSNGRSRSASSRGGSSRRGSIGILTKGSTSRTGTPPSSRVSNRSSGLRSVVTGPGNSTTTSKFSWSTSQPLSAGNSWQKLPKQPERSTPDILGQRSHFKSWPSTQTHSHDTKIEVVEDEDTDHLNEVIMAIEMKRDGRVGCAYYVAVDEAFFIENDMPMGGLEVVSTLILRVQPTTILIPNRAPQDLVLLLEQDAEGLSENGGSYLLRHLSGVEFDYDEAKGLLVEIDLGPSMPDAVQINTPHDSEVHYLGSSLNERLMRLGETIDLNNHLSIGCAGALLGNLNRRRSIQDSDSETTPSFQIRELKMNTATSILKISADALVSLQIVRTELRPDYQGSNSSESKAKQVLSLYGLLQALACTAEGKAKLREMIFLPTTHIALINERQRTIGVLLLPENRAATDNIRSLLKRTRNIKTPLLHIRKLIDRIRGQLSIRVEQYKTLLQFCMVSVQLKEALLPFSRGSGPEIFSRIYNTIDSQSLLSVGERVLQTFDFQLSQESRRTEILQGASEELDRLRERYTEAYDMLPRVREAVVSTAPGWASSYIQDCIIFPGHGFLITVTLDEKTGEGAYTGEDLGYDAWEMIFVREGLVHYKNQMMRQMDEEFGDPATDIANEELRVVYALSREILGERPAIIEASKLFGELDSLIALALAAEKYGWAKPQITASNIIDIADGRHPLQELLVPSFIPNDCVLTGGRGEADEDDSSTEYGKEAVVPSILILTGPNSSGKSIYMKQVALIVYLAHIGSYVPASRATIGITDRILTRIATRETMMADESAFCIDLKQAAFSVNFATRRSLIVADEFGKGTTWHCGAGLLASFVNHFQTLDEYRPKLLIGTHFHELYDYGVLPRGNGVEYAHLDVRLDPDAEELEDQITYLYKLLPGPGGQSLGILCAELMGVEGRILEQAEYFLKVLKANTNHASVKGESIKEVIEEDERLRSAEPVFQRFLTLKIPEADAPQEELDKVKEMLSWCVQAEEEHPDQEQHAVPMTRRETGRNSW